MNSVILLVDDNAVQALARKAILERSGQRVMVAPDGRQALELLQSSEGSKHVTLLITDHLMPAMNGSEFVGEARRRGFQKPIIVLSGLPEAESAYEGLDVIFRLKPFPPDGLIKLVQGLLRPPMTRTA